eukprot:CAMPEP_0184754162 /NCGR_PEP_ID=MMETSP0315-20130426/44476_1 /TAXON_ID=101924 /ORGANISM="Rhodosorus marinus, Strain UTEX LB 2760" /LENGTH=1001 /DNA_ID=CAMNT_0027233565 /DNA_START=99 /DNA_END=3104 /DNA_ORIENTATION=+
MNLNWIWLFALFCIWVRGEDADPDKFYALDGRKVVKIGAPGTNYREVLQFDYEVEPTSTKCGKQARRRLQSILDSRSDLQEKLSSISDKNLIETEDIQTIEDDFVKLEMVRAGFSKPQPCAEGASLAESGKCKVFERAGKIAAGYLKGCIYDDVQLCEEDSLAVQDSPAVQLNTTSRVVQSNDFPSGFKLGTYVAGARENTDFQFVDNDKILLLRKIGLILLVSKGKIVSTFSDFQTIVNDYFDRGAVALVLHPNFQKNRFVYTYFTYEHDPRPSQYEGMKSSRLMRMTSNADYTKAVGGSRKTILGSVNGPGCSVANNADCIPNESRGHPGGGVTFHNGYLYVATGDSSWSRPNAGGHRAQQMGHMIGKVLRINPMNGQGLPENPFYKKGMPLTNINSKIFAIGVRSPFSLEGGNNKDKLWLGDVMWQEEEKLTVVSPGANMGWPCYEGNIQRKEYLVFKECQNFNKATSVKPVLTWNRGKFGTAAAVSGPQININGWPQRYRNVRLYGDMAARWIGFMKIDQDDNVVRDIERIDATGNPIRFRVDPRRTALYVSEVRQSRVRIYTYKRNTEPLRISASSPKRDERVNPNGLEISVKFTKTIEPSSVQGNVFLQRQSGARVPVTVGVLFQQGTVTLKPNSNLMKGENYAVIVKCGSNAGVVDLHGVGCNQDLRIDFRTNGGSGQDKNPPRVISTNPKDGAKAVARTVTIKVVFNEVLRTPVRLADVQLFWEVNSNNKVEIFGKALEFDKLSKTLEIRPIEPLDVGENYRVRLSKAITDEAGNRMRTNHNFSFKTKGPAAGSLKGEITVLNPGKVNGFPVVTVGEDIRWRGTMRVPGTNERVPASAIRFQFEILHCNFGGSGCHKHITRRYEGTPEVTLEAPDHADSFYYEIIMSASHKGASGSVKQRVNLRTVNVRFGSNPGGAAISVNGISRKAPFTLPLAIGSINDVLAPFNYNGRTFSTWRTKITATNKIVAIGGGKNRQREVRGPNKAQTWTAVYA